MHLIPQNLIDSLTSGPSATKTTQVANMQNFIQDLLGSTHHTFLQGSYKNDTAISDINDVDIVAIRLKTYSGTYSSQPVSSTVYWDQIFSEIEAKLRNQSRYNWTVTRGDKCICVRGAFNADVVPAVQVNRDHLIDPIVVYSFRDRREKLNYPRIHYQNGVRKNAATDGRYKPLVRMFKNWTLNHFGNNNTVSSFKTEALVHSIADSNFFDDQTATFIIAANSTVASLDQAGSGPKSILSVCGQENVCANWHLNDINDFVSQLRESASYGLNAYQASSRAAAETYWRSAFNL